jgi:hypothetical protein
LRPNAATQEEMVLGAFCEILLKASEGDRVIFCVPGPDTCFEASAYYGIDGITEKVHSGTIMKVLFRPYSHETQYCDKKDIAIKRYCDTGFYLPTKVSSEKNVMYLEPASPNNT